VAASPPLAPIPTLYPMPKIRDPAADCPNRGRRLSRRGRYNPEQDRRADPFFVVNCSTVEKFTEKRRENFAF
jgi:hypothetical protein